MASQKDQYVASQNDVDTYKNPASILISLKMTLMEILFLRARVSSLSWLMMLQLFGGDAVGRYKRRFWLRELERLICRW
jgi:hypothetical protein